MRGCFPYRKRWWHEIGKRRDGKACKAKKKYNNGADKGSDFMPAQQTAPGNINSNTRVTGTFYNGLADKSNKEKIFMKYRNIDKNFD